MREILIISGKGGTGKTSLAGALADLAPEPVVCDLDVDAPDLHLLLQPDTQITEEFYSGNEAVIDPDRCTNCGKCLEMCRYEAIVPGAESPSVEPLKCEGCKVCVALCPEEAIDFPTRHCGRWYVSDTRVGPMVHAQLFPGQENSGRLVALLRQEAKALAEAKGRELILCDGTPGIGCPVIASLSGISLAVAVTEPTPSGRHDLERVLELCDHFRVPVAVIINKADLNPGQAGAIEKLCAARSLPLLAKIPHDNKVVEAMVAGKLITEHDVDILAKTLHRVWEQIDALAGDRSKH